jgi:putative holliday junction resolvase
MTPTFTNKGRVLALDLGEKRIGVAVSDGTRTIAQALTMFKRSSRRDDFAQIGRLLAEQRGQFAADRPADYAGWHRRGEGAWVRDYAAELAEHIAVPIVFLMRRSPPKRRRAACGRGARRGGKSASM